MPTREVIAMTKDPVDKAVLLLREDRAFNDELINLISEHLQKYESFDAERDPDLFGDVVAMMMSQMMGRTD